MNLRLWKETRVLLPLSISVFITMNMVMLTNDLLLHTILYVLSCFLICSCSFGVEFANRTDLLLLSQPISRRILWLEKMGLLVFTLIILYFMIRVSGSILAVIYYNFGLPRIYSQNLAWHLGLYNQLDSINVLITRFSPFVPVIAICSVPIFTLLTKSGLGGMILSICVPVTGFSLICTLVPKIGNLSGNIITAAEITLCFYSIVCYIAGYKLFLRYEASGSNESASVQELESSFGRLIQKAFPRSNLPIWNLIRKEVLLHQVTFLLVATCWGIYILGFSLSWMGLKIPDTFFAGTTSIYLGLIPILLGVCSITEERQRATVTMQLSLPISSQKQWMIKVSTVYLLTFFFYAIVFIPLIFSQKEGHFDNWVKLTQLSLMIAILFITLPGTSIFMASFSTSNLRALANSFAGSAVVLYLAYTTCQFWRRNIIDVYEFFGMDNFQIIKFSANQLVEQEMYPYYITTGVSLILVGVFLASSFSNFRSLDFSVHAWLDRMKAPVATFSRIAAGILLLLTCIFGMIWMHGKWTWDQYKKGFLTTTNLPVDTGSLLLLPDDENVFKHTPFRELLDKESNLTKEFNTKLSSAFPGISFTNSRGSRTFNTDFIVIQVLNSSFGKGTPDLPVQLPESSTILSLMQDELKLLEEALASSKASLGQEVYSENFNPRYPLTMCGLMNLKAVHHLKRHKPDEAFESLQSLFRLNAVFHQHLSSQAAWFRSYSDSLLTQTIQLGLKTHSWNEAHLLGFQTYFSDQGNYLEQFNKSRLLEAFHLTQTIENDIWPTPYRSNQYLFDHKIHRLKFSPWKYHNLGNYLQLRSLESEQLTSDMIDPKQNSSKRIIGPANVLINNISMKMYEPYQVYRECLRKQSIIACALERFHLKHKFYPSNLDQLRPEFLNEIPRDVLRGIPFQYRLKANHLYVLYSWGWNGVDDGGLTSFRRNSPHFAPDWVWAHN